MDNSPAAVNPHLCRTGPYCRDATHGPHTTKDGWLPAVTTLPNTLCPKCMRDVAAAVGGLWDDYLGLHGLIRHPSAGLGSEIRASSPTPQVPINVHADALMVELEEVAGRCAIAITIAIGQDPPKGTFAIAASLAVIEQNIDVLLDVPSHKAWVWNRAGDGRECIELDGIGLARALVVVHRKAREAIGVDRPRDRMPVPCPRCESRQLVRFHGTTDVTCQSCRSTFPDTQYQQLTMIGAQVLSKESAR
ncbi:hypothetical protein I1A62_29970 [Rhodococcus sp. USK10]|uniref:hypothetical protein n=1 Tax=Rhodococcus sp. USK10 TaxID=2789739 RepID=UPI001C5F2070|nr:hypothetical protein [Rhodococcus sp. USK10]QYB01462.1 hypothetical protein I1A62_29970 [Rhodococcus sp. USK10]